MSVPEIYDTTSLTYLQSHLNKVASNDPNLRSTIDGTNTKLDTLYNTVRNNPNTLNGIIDHQSQMNAILTNEKNRLDDKKANIDSAYDGKTRAVALNESYRQRYRHILKIITVIIVTLILFILIAQMSTMYPFVPSIIFDFLTIIVISAGIFSVYFLTIAMIKRSRVNFDQLEIPGPTERTNAKADNKTSSNKSVWDLLEELKLSQCVGQECCSDGTYWIPGNNVCSNIEPPLVSSFITISDSYKLGEMSGAIRIKPDSPNEFSEYTLIR